MQGTFDELGTPLRDVTFVVVDLETTGGSPLSCAITEIGAVKVRGGEVLGEFQTLVNPGEPIPPFIAVLTGITDTMVAPAPRIGPVLPAFASSAATRSWSRTTRRSTSGSSAPRSPRTAGPGPRTRWSTPLDWPAGR